MARSSKTAQEFIQDSFSPIIGILCSQQVENVVSKNNLSFSELLQPFATFDWDGQFRDPSGSTCLVKNWKLLIRNVNWKPLPPTDARRQLNNAALHNYNDKTITLEFEGRKFDVPQSTPWFDAWRETYLEVQFPSDHEFTKHFLSCIIVATTHDENIVDTFNSLNQQYAQLQNVTPPKLPKWFTSGVLKSYLLLHDASCLPKDKADVMFENLKQSFGASNCFMVTINSKSSTDPNLPTDYWIQYIRRTQETTNSEALSPPNTAVTPSEQRVHQQPQKEENISNSSVVQEGMHPLTTIENDVYDNANSLQTHLFSDSSESVNVVGKTLDYTTEQHGANLNASDVEGIKKFIQEYASNALLPYIEKQIAQLSEVVANRKGVSRSLLSATKRWFGTGKSGSTTGNNTVIYTSDCPELQLRRLGDLWFLCGQWQRAFDTYHTAKREFYADSAWLCYAGALEMAGLSAFMAGTASRKTHGYMEESIVTYLNTCRMVQYAVRATLLSTLCLSSSGSHGEAAKQLIRMTSEDSDLRSAMLLEQAAHCFLSGPGAKAMCRKYAFHMVLSGHRFSKAGQKKHAYRCYRQAHQVYATCGWRLATDHVQFALGRLAGALRLPHEAVRWLAAPLAPAPHQLNRPQSASQQDAFLREYMLAQQQWVESCADFKECLPVVPLPLVERRATRVMCVGPAPLSSPGRVPATSLSLHPEETQANAPSTPTILPPQHPWHTLEQMLLQAVTGTRPMIFKPTIDLYTENTDCNPVVPQGEPMQISVTLRNPLKISLVLKDVELLWDFVPSKDNDGTSKGLNNESAVAAGYSMDNTYIVHQKLKSIVMEGDTIKPLIFTLTPMRVGHFSIKGLAYKLSNAVEAGNDNLKSAVISGKVELTAGVASIDKLLQIIVVPQAPCLQMTFSETSPEATSGEMRSVDVEFRNVGPVGMRNLHVALSHPDCVALLTDHQRREERFHYLYQQKYSKPTQYSDERAARAGAWRSAAASSCIRVADAVESGATTRARLLMRPHATTAALRLLAYYEPDKTAPAPVPPSVAPHVRAYRLLRHVFNFQVTEIVEVTVIPRRSLKTVDGVTVENLNLAVELKNISNGKEDDIDVEVLEASLLSRQWKLTNLVSAPGHSDRLKSREKLHLILQARRLQDTPPEGIVEWSSQKILAEHPDSTPNIDTSPYCKFVTENKPPFIDSAEKPTQETESSRNGLIQSMFILRWKTYNKKDGRAAVGQHCLWLDCFEKVVSRTKEDASADVPTTHLDEYNSTIDSVETKNKKENNVVVFKMEHLNQIRHNFNQRKLCLVPITINIVNCYGVPVKVFIVMSKKQDGESRGELGWAGALSHGDDIQPAECGVFVRLERFASRRVQVNAVCGAPGAYVIGAAFTATAFAASPSPLHPALPPLDPLLTHVANNTSLLVVRQAA